MKIRDVLLLLLLAAIWGSSFIFIRIGVAALGSLLLADLRVLLAAIVLLIVVIFSRQKLGLRARWRQYAIIGLFNAALPYTLIAFAELRLSASFGAILNATTPLFTALVATIWLREAFTFRMIGGFILGIIGVGVLVGWNPQPLTTIIIISIVASLAGAFFYGVGSVYAKRTFQGVPPLHLNIGQQLGAGVILLPFAVTTLPSQLPDTTAIIAVLALAILCTAFAYLIYFRLVTTVGPTNTTMVTLLVPIFGVIWGNLFLHETVAISTIIGMVIILASVLFLTNISFGTRSVKTVEVAQN